MDKSEEKLVEKLKEKLKEKLEECYPGRIGRAVDYDTFLAAIEKVSPVEIWYTNDPAYGYYMRPAQRILINDDMSERKKMEAALHEVACALCVEQGLKEGSQEKKRWSVKMMEKAGVEYMAGEYFGLDQEECFFGDIINWSKGMDMKELLSSMEFIRKTAENLIDRMEGEIREVPGNGLKRKYIAEDLKDLQMLLPKTQETREADRKKKEQTGQSVKFSYYVVNDAYGKKEKSSYQYFDDLDLAFDAYADLPNHLMKQIGMVDSEQSAFKISLLGCLNGWEEIIDLSQEGLPGEKWICEETREALRKVHSYVDNHETEIAYKAGNGYFALRTVSGGYDYTVYDQHFKEVDGGIFDYPNVSIREAMTDILMNDGIMAEQCPVIAYKEFQENVKNAASQEEIRKEARKIEDKIPPKPEKKAETRKETTRANKKSSVLSALRERQSRLHEQKKEKVKHRNSTHKKGIVR